MINERSVPTDAAARLADRRMRPLYDSDDFARIPGTLFQWRERSSFEQHMRRHHGGLEPAEAETWLGALVP